MPQAYGWRAIDPAFYTAETIPLAAPGTDGAIAVAIAADATWGNSYR